MGIAEDVLANNPDQSYESSGAADPVADQLANSSQNIADDPHLDDVSDVHHHSDVEMSSSQQDRPPSDRSRSSSTASRTRPQEQDEEEGPLKKKPRKRRPRSKVNKPSASILKKPPADVLQALDRARSQPSTPAPTTPERELDAELRSLAHDATQMLSNVPPTRAPRKSKEKAKERVNSQLAEERAAAELYKRIPEMTDAELADLRLDQKQYNLKTHGKTRSTNTTTNVTAPSQPPPPATTATTSSTAAISTVSATADSTSAPVVSAAAAEAATLSLIHI